MNNYSEIMRTITSLNALMGGLFIITAIGIIAVRQIGACLKLFVLQSIFLAISAFLLGYYPFSIHLIIVGIINIVIKVIFLPWLLYRLLKRELYTKREITKVVSIPTSLIIALAIVVFAYFFSVLWLNKVFTTEAQSINFPIGLSALILGGYALANRREAIPQFLALLVMENGAFYAGIAIAPDLPLFAEIALSFDIFVLIFVIGLLTRTVHEQTGTTAVGKLANLKEEEYK